MSNTKWHIRYVADTGKVSRTRRGRLIISAHHVRLVTPDVDRLLRFYRETLGLEVIATLGQSVDERGWGRHGDVPAHSGREVILTCGNVYLNLIEDRRRRIRPRGRTPSRVCGSGTLCFEVADLDEIRGLLESVGITCANSGRPAVDGTRTLRTLDPDDNVVEFQESMVADHPLGQALLTPPE